MRKLTIFLASFVLLNSLNSQSIQADDDKWKIGRGRVLRQMFGGGDSDASRQQNNNRQQPTPATRNPDPRQQPTPAYRPPQGQNPQQAGRQQLPPQRSAPQPGQYENQNRLQQSNSNPNFDPRRNPNPNNQRLTPAQQQQMQQQRLQWEAQQRAAQQQQSSQQQRSQANAFNRGRGATQNDPRFREPEPNPYPQQSAQQSRRAGDSNFEAEYDRNPNRQVSNKRDKRSGPKPVGFGLELKTDRKDQIYINRLDRGGNAEQAGLRRGDQVLQIGGVDLGSVEEFDEIGKIMRDGDQIELKVQRSGKTADVMLTFGEPLDIPEEGEIQYQRDDRYDDPRSTAAGADYDFVPRQTDRNPPPRRTGEPVVNPNAFNQPRPPSERSRPSLHDLELDLDNDFELPPPRQPQNPPRGARSILETK